jgi:glycosyltransferase involved in cell wall biosynthesis
VRVNLIGRIDTTYRSELEEKLREHSLAEHVVLTRFAAQDELNAYFSAADIGVWPGDPSVAVLEAMSSRLPVVAMRTPYTEAIIERPEAGRLVSSTTSEALAAALRPLVTDGAERVRRGMNARNLIEQELNWGKIAESFVSLYASASSRNFKRSSKSSIGERRHAL